MFDVSTDVVYYTLVLINSVCIIRHDRANNGNERLAIIPYIYNSDIRGSFGGIEIG